MRSPDSVRCPRAPVLSQYPQHIANSRAPGRRWPGRCRPDRRGGPGPRSPDRMAQRRAPPVRRPRRRGRGRRRRAHRRRRPRRPAHHADPGRGPLHLPPPGPGPERPAPGRLRRDRRRPPLRRRAADGARPAGHRRGGDAHLLLHRRGGRRAVHGHRHRPGAERRLPRRLVGRRRLAPDRRRPRLPPPGVHDRRLRHRPRHRPASGRHDPHHRGPRLALDGPRAAQPHPGAARAGLRGGLARHGGRRPPRPGHPDPAQSRGHHHRLHHHLHPRQDHRRGGPVLPGGGRAPPTPSWGRSIGSAITWVSTDPWYLLFPGAALFLVTLAFNLFGDGLRDALDPRTGERR